ncbi:MAG: glycosyltransferase [Chlamydiota bacterium]
MMRGLIYCVHLYGIGHLKRMLSLAEGLVEDCEITLIQAGRNEKVTFLHPNFRHIGIPLPRSMIPFITNNEAASFEKLMKIRRRQLFTVMDFSRHYDFFITEQIPFTKLAFLCEAYSIMNALKIKNPNLAMISSNKGGAPFNEPGKSRSQPRKDEQLLKTLWESTLKELRANYDKVLVHVDPQITTLDETFVYFDEIREMVEYTGYIYPCSEKFASSKKRKKEILITTGSGIKGVPLLLSLLNVVPNIPEYNFQFVITPEMNRDFVELLHRESEKLSNMQIVSFLDNFDEKLRESSLAITLAGSTLINLYATSTPALVYRDLFDRGQVVQGQKFADHGIVNLINEQDLSPDKLKNLILETLQNPPKSDIDLNIAGVENSKQAIMKTVQEKRQSANQKSV